MYWSGGRPSPGESELERVATLGRLLLASGDVDEVLEGVAQGLCEFSGLRRSVILGYDPGTGRVHGRAGWGVDRRELLDIDVPVMAGPMAARAIREKQPQFTHDPVPDDPTLAAHLRRFGSLGSMAVFPLQTEQFGTVGLAFLEDEGARFELDEDVVRVLTAFVDLGALAIQNAQLTERSRRLAAVLERSRAAREVHDSITQSLFALRLGLDDLVGAPEVPDAIRERVGRLRDDAQAVVADMHRTLHALTEEEDWSRGSETPAADDLVSRIASTFHHSLAEYDLAGDLEITGTGVEPGAEAGDLMVRLIKESLLNVVRYAEASEVVVHVRMSDTWWTVEVSDDGIGDPSEVRRYLARNLSSFGLSSLQREAKLLGGRVWIREARRLGGLCVSLAVPVEPEPEWPGTASS